MEEKAFAVITKDSVRLMAEMAGYSNISEDVASLLGEDVTYRLRETVMKSAAFMKNAKRRRLCPEDFNQALRDIHVQPVYGQSSTTDSTPFRQTREGELHFVEDHDVNFNNTVFNCYVPKSLGKASIKAQWMAVEGVSKLQSSSHSLSSLQNASKFMKKELPAELMNYYSQITQALVGSRPVLVKLALEDLSTNDSIVPLLTYFVNFIASGVKAVSHDVAKLTLLMRTVEALVWNQTMFLEIQPYLNLLVQSVETCLLEPLAAYMTQQSVDHWILRQLAARVLAQIVRKWENPRNGLHASVADRLTEILQDLKRPHCAHYGAIMGLMALGPAEVERVLKVQLPALLPHLQSALTEPKTAVQRQDAFRVHAALQMVAEKLIKSRMESKEDDSVSAVNSSPTDPDRLKLFQQLIDYFGDVLALKLPVTKVDKLFGWQPPSECISLGDTNSRRSGEELLADLMQQVKQEEEARRRLQQQQTHESDRLAGNLHFQVADGSSRGTELSQLMHRCSEESDDLEQAAGFQEQLEVSSTISDPSKGTLKLKIKRHPQGQGSPSQSRLTLQLNKGRTDQEQQQSREARDKEYRHKRKRKQTSKNPWEQEGDLSDGEDGNSSLHNVSQLTPVYSPGDESSSSDSTQHRKGKLTLKLKVPSKDSTSE